jgi:hypothetical protein
MMGYDAFHVFAVGRNRGTTVEEVEEAVNQAFTLWPKMKWSWDPKKFYYCYVGEVRNLGVRNGQVQARQVSDALGFRVFHLCWGSDEDVLLDGLYSFVWINGESYGESEACSVSRRLKWLQRDKEKLEKEVAELREYIQHAYGEPVMGVLPGRESAVCPEPREDSTEVKL